MKKPSLRRPLPLPASVVVIVLAAALWLIAGRGKSPDSSAAQSGGGPSGAASGDRDRKLTVAFLPKSKGNAYFISCKAGAEKAARALGVDLLFDGPTESDPAKQNEIVENWIALGVDVIAAACENKEGIFHRPAQSAEQGHQGRHLRRRRDARRPRASATG